jgi:hypothetical protein
MTRSASFPTEVKDVLTCFGGDTTQIQEHRVDLHHDRFTAWGGTRKLIPTLLAELFGLAGDRAVVDEPITLALGTYLHRYPPFQT